MTAPPAQTITELLARIQELEDENQALRRENSALRREIKDMLAQESEQIIAQLAQTALPRS